MHERKLDSKFSVNNALDITNNYTGQIVPEDEPLFIFRAKDMLAITALLAYRELCLDHHCDDLHIESIVDACQRFKDWQMRNPSLVKLPDTRR